MEMLVIDVSKHQGSIDWNKVKAAGTIGGVILRCGYGSDIEKQDDERFLEYADSCTKLGIPFGAYLYSYAKNTDKAKSEAAHALRLVKGYQLSFPLYFDAEQAGTEDVAKDNAIVFCEAVKAAGYMPGVYANEYWWKNYLVGLDAYTKWVAKYNANNGQQGTKPSVDGMDMWQYTSNGSCDGITSDGLDVSVCYRDFRAEFNPGKEDAPAPSKSQCIKNAKVGSWQHAWNIGFDVAGTAGALAEDNSFGPASQKFASDHNIYRGIQHRKTAVKWWQGVIGVTQDGSFGQDTYNATVKWQEAHNLVPDGAVGLATITEALQ